MTRSILAITAAFSSVRADRMAGGNHLRHFMHGGTHIDPVGLRVNQCASSGYYRRVEEDGDGTEDNHRGDGDRHFTGFGFDHRFGGEHSRRAAEMLLPAPISQLVCLSRPNTFATRKQAMKKVLESVRTSIAKYRSRRRRQSGRTSGGSRRG